MYKSCLVEVVDSETAGLMMGDTSEVKGYHDGQLRPSIWAASSLTAVTDVHRETMAFRHQDRKLTSGSAGSAAVITTCIQYVTPCVVDLRETCWYLH